MGKLNINGHVHPIRFVFFKRCTASSTVKHLAQISMAPMAGPCPAASEDVILFGPKSKKKLMERTFLSEIHHDHHLVPRYLQISDFCLLRPEILGTGTSKMEPTIFSTTVGTVGICWDVLGLWGFSQTYTIVFLLVKACPPKPQLGSVRAPADAPSAPSVLGRCLSCPVRFSGTTHGPLQQNNADTTN